MMNLEILQIFKTLNKIIKLKLKLFNNPFMLMNQIGMQYSSKTNKQILTCNLKNLCKNKFKVEEHNKNLNLEILIRKRIINIIMIYSKSNLLNKMVLKHQVFRIKTNLVIMPAANQIILIWILIRKNHKRKPRLRKTSKMIYKEMLKLMKISEISKPAINLKLQTIHFRFQIIQ